MSLLLQYISTFVESPHWRTWTCPLCTNHICHLVPHTLALYFSMHVGNVCIACVVQTPKQFPPIYPDARLATCIFTCLKLTYIRVSQYHPTHTLQVPSFHFGTCPKNFPHTTQIRVLYWCSTQPKSGFFTEIPHTSQIRVLHRNSANSQIRVLYRNSADVPIPGLIRTLRTFHPQPKSGFVRKIPHTSQSGIYTERRRPTT